MLHAFNSLTFISFEENYQTAEIYFYSYHVIPLNKTISNYFVNYTVHVASSNFFPDAIVSAEVMHLMHKIRFNN